MKFQFYLKLQRLLNLIKYNHYFHLILILKDGALFKLKDGSRLDREYCIYIDIVK